jgi:hypothetical protein
MPKRGDWHLDRAATTIFTILKQFSKKQYEALKREYFESEF